MDQTFDIITCGHKRKKALMCPPGVTAPTQKRFMNVLKLF